MKKKVLVTGSTGFLGSHVIAELAKKNTFEVTGTYHTDEPPSKKLKRRNFQGKIKFIPIDLIDFKKTRDLIKRFDYVIHLAALVQGTGRYHDAPATVLSENLTIDTNVLKAASSNGIKRIIYPSSHEALRGLHNYPHPIDETMIEKPLPYPQNAYAFSKLVGDRLVRAFHEEFSLPYTIFYNCSYDYGVLPTPTSALGYEPRIVGGITKNKRNKAGWMPRFIEDTQKILRSKEPLIFRGDPNEKRYWTDLRDTARAYVLALTKKGAENQTFIIASNEMLTYREFVKKFFDKIRPAEPFRAKFATSSRLPSLFHIPDTRKAKRLLGWEARYKLDDSIDQIIAWVKNEFPK